MKTKLLKISLIMLTSTVLFSCSDGKKGKENNTSNYTTPAGMIPIEDFFKNPEKSSFKISPDGKYFAFMSPYESRMNIFVQEIGSEEVVRLTEETERDISTYFWANNNRILYLKDTGGDENYHLYGVDIDGNNLTALTAIPNVTIQIIDDLPDLENEMIIALNKRNPQIFDAYRINIATGDTTLIAKNPGNIQSWITDNDGKLRMAIALDVVTAKLLYRDNENEEFKLIDSGNFKESLNPLSFTPDNKRLYMASNRGRDKSTLIEYDPTTAKEIKVLYENSKYDVQNIIYSRKNKKLQGVVYDAHKGMEQHFFDNNLKSTYAKLEARFPELKVAISSRNKAEDKFIVVTYSDLSRGSYYYYDATKDEINKLADLSPWINEDDMSQMNCVTYTSRDGLEIEAYLTLPNGISIDSAKNLPTVINPHGGPWARDSWGYNPEAQFLANRGYAVLQMNFRGSVGYGRNFWELSFKQWGKTMQDDISDGVYWLIQQGIADSSRIAIYGASYGGYACLAGLTFTPDLYACGIDYVGVSNLFTFMNTIPPYWKPLLDMMYEMVGDPVKDKELLESASPVMHVDKIKVPLFIAQGANDPRVNKDESDQMVKALKKRGIEVEYMVKDNEGHGFANEENRFEFYRAMEMFLTEHL